MSRIFKISRLFIHIIKALYLYVRYFYTTKPDIQGFSEFQLDLMKQWFAQVLNILNIEVIATKPINIYAAPKVYVANHISWLDIVVIGQFISIRFIAKSEVASWPVINRLASKAGAIFIRRGKATDMKNVAEKVNNVFKLKENVAFFPEGKTSCGDSLLPIFSGLFQIAIDNKTAVVPMILSYDDGSYPATQLPFVGEQSLMANVWKICGLSKIKVYLSAGDEINTEAKERKALANQVSKQMNEMLKEQLGQE